MSILKMIAPTKSFLILNNSIFDKKSLASQPTLSGFFKWMDEITQNQFHILMHRFRKVEDAIKRAPLLFLSPDSTFLDT